MKKVRTIVQIKASEERWFRKAAALAEALDAVAGVGASVRVLENFGEAEELPTRKGRAVK